jgi:LysM repeat protein
MTILDEWRARFFARDSLQFWGAISLLSLALIGLLLLIALLLVPEIRQRAGLREQLEIAKGQLSAAQTEKAEAPRRLETQLVAAETRLHAAANAFLGEAEATVVLNRLYTYAQAAGVEIVNLQTGTAMTTATHTQRNFQFQVVGPLNLLLDFLGSMSEVKLPGFFVDNVSMVEDQDRHLLNMSVAIYTSPYSVQGATPRPLENLAELPLPQVQEQLEVLWSTGDWERAIRILDQVLVVDPANDSARITLYRAHVNYGYQLLAARNSDAATEQFNGALGIEPTGREALVELEQLAADDAVAYVVQDRLRQELVQASINGNWQEVIRFLRLIQAVDPVYGPLDEELYQAYINYGNQLVTQGNATGAEEQYQLARSILPDRELPPLPQIAPTVTLTLTQTPQVIAAALVVEAATPLPTATPVPSATAATLPTAVPSATPTATPTVIPTVTAQATATPVPPATATPTATPTLVGYSGATATATATLLVVLPIDPLPNTRHVVQPGDTLYSIARRYETSVDALMRTNGLATDGIRIGQTLLITAFPVPPADYTVYIVARNDTLLSLAQRFGTTVDAIMRINNLPNTQINPGQQLLIPHS